MEKITTTDSIITLIGLGFIDDSITRVIRKARPDIRIMAYVCSRSRLEQARQEGIVDTIPGGIDENLRGCDLIFLYTSVEYNAGHFSAIWPYLEQGALITDVGSTKCSIREEVRRRGLEHCFVGGHPMAGSEETDYESSTGHLLESACYIVAPPEGKNSSHPQALSPNVERIMAVARTIGAIPLVLDYKEHGKVVAVISHFPHLVTSSLVNLIKDHNTADGIMKQVVAGGFKDIVRTASSSPEMWGRMCMTNVESISNILEAYIASLNKALEEIRERKGQDIYRLLETSRDYRNSIIGKAKGPVEPPYEFTVDVSDEVGAIPTMSVIPATKGINIKNIGIDNNRERGEGALKIAFYDEASMEAAWQELDKCKYEVFRMQSGKKGQVTDHGTEKNTPSKGGNQGPRR